MKDILSKIGKSLLIPALTFSINTKNLEAQQLEIKPEMSVGVGLSHYPDLKVYPDWSKHFNGLNDDEKLITKKIVEYPDWQAGLDLGLKFKKFSFGISSRYSIAEAIKEKSLSYITLDNWDYDYARIHEMTLKQTNPSLGAYVKFPIDELNEFAIKYYFRKVQINEIKREDKNIIADLKCAYPLDETEELTREFERTSNKIPLSRICLEWQGLQDAITQVEVYYETDWNKIHRIGANLGFYFNLPQKKKDS